MRMVAAVVASTRANGRMALTRLMEPPAQETGAPRRHQPIKLKTPPPSSLHCRHTAIRLAEKNKRARVEAADVDCFKANATASPFPPPSSPRQPHLQVQPGPPPHLHAAATAIGAIMGGHMGGIMTGIGMAHIIGMGKNGTGAGSGLGGGGGFLGGSGFLHSILSLQGGQGGGLHSGGGGQGAQWTVTHTGGGGQQPPYIPPPHMMTRKGG